MHGSADKGNSTARWARFIRTLLGVPVLALLVGVAVLVPSDAGAQAPADGATDKKSDSAAKPLPVEVIGPAAVTGSEGRARLWLSIRETAGIDLEGLRVELVGLDCKSKDEPAVQVSGKLETEQTFKLGKHERRRLDLILVGGPPAGECQARLAMWQGEHEPRPLEIKVLHRRSLWLGIVLIAVSVIVSSLLRLSLGAWLPAREAQRRALLAVERLNRFAATSGPFDPAERSCFEDVHMAARRTYDGLRWVLRAPEEKEVLALEQRVELLERCVRARRLLKGIRLPVEQRRKNKADLERAEAALRGRPSSEELTGLIGTVRAIEDRAEQAVGEQLTGPIEAFRAELAKQAPELQPKLDEVRGALEAAGEAVTSGDQELARTKFDDARRRYVQLLADWLRGSMPEKAPAGFKDQEWQELTAEIKRDLEALQGLPPEVAPQRYQEVHRRYLDRLLKALSGEAKQWMEGVAGMAAADVGKKEKLGGMFVSVEAELRLAAEALAGGDLGAASGTYTEAAARFMEARREMTGGSPMGPGAAARDPAATWPMVGDYGALQAVLSPESAASLPGIVAHDRGTLGAELALTAATLAIAVLSGLRLLEVRSPTWGDGSDLLVAALWGLGLHQVSGAAFSGLGEIRKLFTK